MREINECIKCGYIWFPRGNKMNMSRACPSCQTILWHTSIVDRRAMRTQRERKTRHGWESFNVGESRHYKLSRTGNSQIDDLYNEGIHRTMMAYQRKSGFIFWRGWFLDKDGAIEIKRIK